MTRIKVIAILVAVVGSSLYLHSYFNPPETWENQNAKGISLFHEIRYAEAEKHFLQALKISKTYPPNDYRLRFSLNQLAEIYRIQSKYIEAEKVLKKILTMDEKEFGLEHSNVALTLNNLAANYRLRGQYEESEASLKRALNILERSLNSKHPLVGNILEHYAYLLHQIGRSDEAEKLEKRYQIIYSHLGNNEQ